MKCQICKKNNVNTHITKNINGNVSELFLCSDCAKDLGYNNVFHKDLLSFDNFWSSLSELNSISNPLRCDVCGSTFNEISNTGKIGCENCYKIFIDQLMPTIKRLHGNSAKYCNDTSTETIIDNEYTEIQRLEQELKNAVDIQDFEKAAEIRDEIKKLKDEN